MFWFVILEGTILRAFSIDFGISFIIVPTIASPHLIFPVFYEALYFSFDNGRFYSIGHGQHDSVVFMQAKNKPLLALLHCYHFIVFAFWFRMNKIGFRLLAKLDMRVSLLWLLSAFLFYLMQVLLFLLYSHKC